MISRLAKSLLLVPLLPLVWYAYGAALEASMPHVAIREVAPLVAPADRALPFFELMSPLPELAGAQILPKLEYKKGPPDRYLERIQVLFEKDRSAKERIVYYGRRSRGDLLGLGVLPDDPAREARYVELAIRASQGQAVPELSGLAGFLYRPFFFREANKLLGGFETVTIMDQAGTPAFLFQAAPGEGGRAKASALFIRRNAFYRVDYFGDRGFSLVDPEQLFRKSFLTERRSDALAYISHGLSEVKLEPSQGASLKLADVTWTILLLAANVSVDPASIESYFHFAGINALLYRNSAGAEAPQDLEFTDTLRSNVLSSDLYAQDVAPDAPKTAEIGRFARLLTRNFDQ